MGMRDPDTVGTKDGASVNPGVQLSSFFGHGPCKMRRFKPQKLRQIPQNFVATCVHPRPVADSLSTFSPLCDR